MKPVTSKVSEILSNKLKTLPKNPDLFYQALRMPKFSLISVYGRYAQLGHYILQRALANHVFVNDTQAHHAKTGEDLVDFAGEVTTVVDIDRTAGTVLYNFPATKAQAIEFETITDGVNLAIHFEVCEPCVENLAGNYHQCKSCGLVFNTGLNYSTPTQQQIVGQVTCEGRVCNPEHIKDVDFEDEPNEAVLNYYKSRGQLLTFKINESEDLEQSVQRLANEIRANIKL